jgi:hypothetical protein
MRLTPLAIFTLAATLLVGDAAMAQFFPPRPPRDVDRAVPPPREDEDDDDLLRPEPVPQQQPRQQQPRQVRPPAGFESAPLPPPGQIAVPPQPQQQPRQQQRPQQTREQPPQPQQGVAPIVAPPVGRPGQPPAQVKLRPGERQQPYDSEVKVEQPPEQKIANQTAVFSGLDKITGRIIIFDVAINETVQFGPLQVTPRVCYTRPPTETQNTTGFVEVDEITLKSEIRRIYTGWMFASSPGLHAVEHPIYDVWLADCKMTPPAIAASGGKR